MQRTVKVTKVKYIAKTEAGLTEKVCEIANFDESRFIRELKKAGVYAIVTETETREKTYILDDEIFFKYATVKEEPTIETEQAQ